MRQCKMCVSIARQAGYLIVGGGVLAGSLGRAVGHRQLQHAKEHLPQLLAGAQVQLGLPAQPPHLLRQLPDAPLQWRLPTQTHEPIESTDAAYRH